VRRTSPAVFLLALLVAACGTSEESPSSSAEPIASPEESVAACADGDSLAPAAVDRSLLEVLPETIAGIAVEPSPDGEAAGLSDACLAKIADSFASGFAADPENFVFAVVAGLRPEALDDVVFRSWRDSFDEGACSQADGVLGHAETEIDGRTVYIGTCVGGLRTYHVWLEENEVLISASAVGERRLGELLVENLRP
jgi:hypothetical protein